MTHIGRSSIPGTSRQQVQRVTSDAVLTQGSALHERSSALRLRAALLEQCARTARKGSMPAWSAHLGTKRISAKYPKVLLWSLTTCSFPFC